MKKYRDWEQERNQILAWLNSQHEAIQINSFDWNGVKLEYDGFWYKTNGDNWSCWEYALDHALLINEGKE